MDFEQDKDKQKTLVEIARGYSGELTPKLKLLEPYREGISELRSKGASYTTITMILKELGVGVTRYAVIRYCQQALGNWGSAPKRGKRIQKAETQKKTPSVPATFKRTASEISFPDVERRGPRIADPRTL